MRKLESQKIIRRYFPVIDLHKLGYHTIRLMFDLEEMEASVEKELIEFLDKEINVGLIFRMDYPYRYGFIVWVRSVYDVDDIIVRMKTKLGQTMVGYNFTVFTRFKVYPKDYLFGKEQHDTYHELRQQDRVEYDNVDFAILQHLADDARRTTVEISNKINVPQTTVSSKIKRMERTGIILGYRAEIDYIGLGHMNYFMELYLTTNEDLASIEAWADMHKNVIWLQRIVGTCDIEIEVEIKGRVEFEALMNDLKRQFPSIRKIVFFSQDYKKITFLPGK